VGHYLVDTCSFWVSYPIFTTMDVRQVDFSKVLNDDQVYDHMMRSYDQLGRDWIVHQWSWMNNVYRAFNDHYKYLIVISLVEKTLHFYDQMNIQFSFDQFYSKSSLQVEKFSITELCEKLQLPKETVRRKVLELEKLGVIKRIKKQLLIDRSVFSQVKPERQIKLTSKYIYLISKIFNKDKIYLKKLDTNFIEDVIRKNFSLCWRWFYRMQIPMIIGYHEMFEDIATFHLWGTVVMNQAFNYKKNMNKTNMHSLTPDYITFNKGIVLDQENDETTGVSAMSLSDMTNIPRATVIRKCKYLMSEGYLKLNNKKQYVMTGMNMDKILPYQKKIFRNKAKFLRKTLNLLIIS
jgi:DNA-binding transcriptional regulator YhcF (GntR family)